MAENAYIVVWLIWIIVAFISYHKLFDVYYFNLGRGLLKELGTCAIIGLIMTAITFYYWWLSVIVVILIGIGMANKVNNKIPIVISIILAIIFAMSGHKLRNNEEEKNDEKALSYIEFKMESLNMTNNIF